MAALKETEDLISVGAYVPGSNARVDDALARRDRINAFLRQNADAPTNLEAALEALYAI